MTLAPPDDSQRLRRSGAAASLIQRLLLAATFAVLAATSAYATEPVPQGAASEALRPYLGKWRPTSFRRELNIGSITVAETGFSYESGGSMTFEFVKKVEEGVIVRITGRQPANTHPEVTALGLSLETKTLTGPPPAGVTRQREELRICYGFGDIDDATKQLVSDMKSGRCPYTHIR